MKKVTKNLIAVFVVIFLVLPVFVQAGFVDEEVSAGNSIGASSLDAEVTSGETELQLPTIAGNMLPGNSITRTGIIQNVGRENFKYKIVFDKVSGDDALCSALQVKAKKNGSSVYSNNLSDFDYNVGVLNSGSSDSWSFEIILPSDSVSGLENLDCNFKFTYTAWQVHFAEPTHGWVDEEEIDNNNIQSGDWTIDAPVQTGYNENNGDNYSTPRNPNEIPCTNGMTDINGISIHWNEVNYSNGSVKYQRQYKVNAGNWAGSEIYNNPYSNYRAFGGGGGNEGVYGSRVRAWVDTNGNNSIDNGEIASDWSNECYITYNKNIPTAQIGDIVLNEFVPRPKSEEKEWVEIYNNTNHTIDVAGWFITDELGPAQHKRIIDSSHTNTGETIVSAGSWLAIEGYDSFYLNDTGDTIKLYDNSATPVLMDEYSYEDASSFDKGKSFARFPDGIGPWIDPEGTPGEKNELKGDELFQYQLAVATVCFKDGQLIKSGKKETICNALFVEYIGLIQDSDSRDLVLKGVLANYFKELNATKKEKEKEKEKENIKEAQKEEDKDEEVVEEIIQQDNQEATLEKQKIKEVLNDNIQEQSIIESSVDEVEDDKKEEIVKKVVEDNQAAKNLESKDEYAKKTEKDNTKNVKKDEKLQVENEGAEEKKGVDKNNGTKEAVKNENDKKEKIDIEKLDNEEKKGGIEIIKNKDKKTDDKSDEKSSSVKKKEKEVKKEIKKEIKKDVEKDFRVHSKKEIKENDQKTEEKKEKEHESEKVKKEQKIVMTKKDIVDSIEFEENKEDEKLKE